jgi:undecaprenyl-diphosphatase
VVRSTSPARPAGVLIGAAAAVLSVAGRFGRRAALRGGLAAGLVTVTGLGTARARGGRAAGATPIAAATAFATGASMEMPWAALPLAAGAAWIGTKAIAAGGRPHVLAGAAAAGVGVALASRRAWPVAPHEAAAARRHLHRGEASPLPDGKGLTVIVNAEAGSALNGGAGGPLRERLPRARVVETDEGADLPEVLAAEADDSIDALGIVGGDGSVNTAAQVALDLGVPLVVVPSGTLNHLARDLGLDGVDDAVAAIARGDVVEIDVGRLDGRPFLNTAAFGAYPDLVDARERIEDRIGKWPAFVLALVRVARRAEPCDVELDGRRRRVWMVFVGNCCYHPSGFAPSWRERLDDGRLDVRVVDASRRLARTRLLFAALSGRLGRSRVYEQSLVRHLEVRSCEGPLRVALDGETLDVSAEFVVDKAPERLRVFVPAR